MKVNLKPLFKNGKSLMLAYDQGLEHGPTDFNDKNVDPQYIIDIANKVKLNGIIFQKGIAEKYPTKSIPLILKLNGKTKLVNGEPYSPPLCSIKEALGLKAKAVGYTLYIGSKHESKMFKEFEKIEEQAHEKGLPVMVWAYPHGKAIKNELSRDTLAYSARICLELGADIIKIKYNGNINDLKWIIKSAGKAKIIIAGGSKKTEQEALKEAKEIMKAGASGMAIGRNIWQHKNPIEIAKKYKKIIFD